MNIRLIGPRLLVKLEDEAERFTGSVLIKPDTVHETAQGWGTVLAVGDGIPTKYGKVPYDRVHVGDRVAFVKFLKMTKSNEALSYVLEDGQIIIDFKDVVVVERDGDS